MAYLFAAGSLKTILHMASQPQIHRGSIARSLWDRDLQGQSIVTPCRTKVPVAKQSSSEP